MDNNTASQEELALRQSLKEDFDNLTENIQAILDIGAAALVEAEDKTNQVAQMDPESLEYDQIVQEVKDAQARAAQAFDQAEKFIAAANDLLPQDTK